MGQPRGVGRNATPNPNRSFDYATLHQAERSPQAARGGSHPSCRHYNIQSYSSLGSAFEGCFLNPKGGGRRGAGNENVRQVQGAAAVHQAAVHLSLPAHPHPALEGKQGGSVRISGAGGVNDMRCGESTSRHCTKLVFRANKDAPDPYNPHTPLLSGSLQVRTR